MMNNNKTRFRRSASAGCTALATMALLAGCASMNQTPEAAVTQRAQEHLDLYLEGNYVEAYKYLSPGYRSSVSLNEYQRKVLAQPMSWTNARVAGSDCTESSCKVRISVDIVVFGAVPGASRFETVSVINENWIKSGGTWFYVPSS